MNQSFEYLYSLADEDMRYLMDERAAIHEFDGGLTRDRAEQRTFGEFVGAAPVGQTHFGFSR